MIKKILTIVFMIMITMITVVSAEPMLAKNISNFDLSLIAESNVCDIVGIGNCNIKLGQYQYKGNKVIDDLGMGIIQTYVLNGYTNYKVFIESVNLVTNTTTINLNGEESAPIGIDEIYHFTNGASIKVREIYDNNQTVVEYELVAPLYLKNVEFYVEEHYASFTKDEFIEGVTSEFASYPSSYEQGSFYNNNYILLEQRDGNLSNIIVAWYSGNTIIIMKINGWEVFMLDDEIFEEILIAYFNIYPSNLEFNAPIPCYELGTVSINNIYNYEGFLAVTYDKIGNVSKVDVELIKSNINNSLPDEVISCPGFVGSCGGSVGSDIVSCNVRTQCQYPLYNPEIEYSIKLSDQLCAGIANKIMFEVDPGYTCPYNYIEIMNVTNNSGKVTVNYNHAGIIENLTMRLVRSDENITSYYDCEMQKGICSIGPGQDHCSVETSCNYPSIEEGVEYKMMLKEYSCNSAGDEFIIHQTYPINETNKTIVEYYLLIGDMIEVGGKHIKLVNIGPSAIVVDVDGVIKTIYGGDTEIVNDIKIKTESIFYVEEKEYRSAVIGVTLPKNVCIESDGGINYYGEGRIYGNMPQSFIYGDMCLDNITIRETYCDSNDENNDGYIGTARLYDCPNGCYNGACLKSLPDLYTESVTLEKSNDESGYIALFYICNDGDLSAGDAYFNLPYSFAVNNYSYDQYMGGYVSEMINDCTYIGISVPNEYISGSFPNYVKLIIDSKNLVKESNENNNIFIENIMVDNKTICGDKYVTINSYGTYNMDRLSIAYETNIDSYFNIELITKKTDTGEIVDMQACPTTSKSCGGNSSSDMIFCSVNTNCIFPSSAIDGFQHYIKLTNNECADIIDEEIIPMPAYDSYIRKDITLTKGWNLISLGQGIEFAANNDFEQNIEAVYVYSPTDKKYYDLFKNDDTLESLIKTQGYASVWIYLNQDINAQYLIDMDEIQQTVENLNFNFEQGWNFYTILPQMQVGYEGGFLEMNSYSAEDYLRDGKMYFWDNIAKTWSYEYYTEVKDDFIDYVGTPVLLNYMYAFSPSFEENIENTIPDFPTV